MEVTQDKVQNIIEEANIRIRKALEEMEEERGRERKEMRGWWNEECKVKKREVRKTLREWRKGQGGGQEYRREKKKYKDLCDRKKQEENRNWEREAEEVSTEGQV